MKFVSSVCVRGGDVFVRGCIALIKRWDHFEVFMKIFIRRMYANYLFKKRKWCLYWKIKYNFIYKQYTRVYLNYFSFFLPNVNIELCISTVSARPCVMALLRSKLLKKVIKKSLNSIHLQSNVISLIHNVLTLKILFQNLI